MEEKQYNWDGGLNPYYWSPSKQASGYIVATCGVLILALAVTLAVLKALGVLA